MNATTYENAQKQPAKRGDVYEESLVRQHTKSRGRRELRVTLRLTTGEWSDLQSRAKAAGVSLSDYIRREVTRSAGVSRETEMVLAEVGRTRELVTRLFDVSVAPPPGHDWVSQVASGVQAIEDRVFVARATRGKA